jgi:DNA-binding transcriptional regulator YhcF (GntR family)
MLKINAKKKTSETLKESEKKWGKAAIAAGFTVFPNVLLSKQHALGLDCYHLVIILQIHKHWWVAGKKPYPSQVQLAKTMNTDRSTVKRKLAELRDLGFITWTERKTKQGGQAANEYDLSGLIAHIQKFAEEELAERAKRADEDKARQQRKRPSLRLVQREESHDE